jgi:hypothetical protein
MYKIRKALALVGMFLLSAFAVVPPQPAQADYAVVSSGPVTVSGTTPIQIGPLTGQSSCNVELNGTIVGTTQVLQNGLWVGDNSVQIPDGGTPSTTITGPGSFTANCASFALFRFVPTSGYRHSDGYGLRRRGTGHWCWCQRRKNQRRRLWPRDRD